MTTVFFVRHAEPNYENHNDSLRELSSKGLKDRKTVTAFLASKKIHTVLSSPYKRAVDTIREFADSVGLDIELVDAFRERKVDNAWIEDFGTFSRRQWNDFSFKLSEGECLKEVQERNVSALREVLQKHKGQNIVIGSHGTALSTIINYYDNTFGYDDYEKIKDKMPWIVEFVFDDNMNCCSIRKHDLLDKCDI